MAFSHVWLIRGNPPNPEITRVTGVTDTRSLPMFFDQYASHVAVGMLKEGDGRARPDLGARRTGPATGHYRAIV